MIPTIVVERRLKGITIQDGAETPQRRVRREGNTDEEGDTLHRHRQTERKDIADTPPLHLKTGRERDIDIRHARRGEETTHGRGAQGTLAMTRRTNIIDHIDITEMIHRTRVLAHQ